MRCRHAWWIRVLGGCLAGAVWATGSTASTTSPAPEPLARGWIVKLKESKPQPVVRLAAAAVPSDGPTSQRSRLWQATQRQRVSMLTHKPTAFGANVVHAGRLLTVAEAEAEARRLRQDPDVEWVEVNVIEQNLAFTGLTPNDPLFTSSQEWLRAKDNSSRAGVAGFTTAWQRFASWGQALSPVAVAVLDTGTLYSVNSSFQRLGEHPELLGRVYPGYDFVSELEFSRDGNGIDDDPNDPGDGLTQDERDRQGILYPPTCRPSDSSWHGFSILNMLAAVTNNGVGGAGILAPLDGLVVLPVRVGSVCGADRSDIIEGMLWAAGIRYQGEPATRNQNHARVISLSFGSRGTCAGSVYESAINSLRQKGTLVVASAGNGNSDGVGDVRPTVPASCPGVLAVTALSQSGYKATYANFVGPEAGLAVAAGDVANGILRDGGIVALSNLGRVDPADPLSDVPRDCATPQPGGPFCTLQSDQFIPRALAGTSFAAPQVAGVAALMLAVRPSTTVDELRQALLTEVSAFRAEGPGMPAACSEVRTRDCTCTTQFCGAGVLDADAAVEWAMNTAASVGTPITPPEVTSGFVPDRARSNSGGGGGALSWPWLAGLAALWMIGAVTGRRAGFRTGRP